MKRYLYLLLYLLLNGCSALPPSFDNIQVVDISLAQVKDNLQANQNIPVRWGGVIIEVENEATSSYLQVLYYPLSFSGKPQISEAPLGRFVVKSDEFLDPAIYAKDKQVTLAGVLSGEVERIIGKKKIRLPLLTSKTIHLWPDPEPNNYYGYGGYGYGPYYYNNYPYFGSPYFWGGYFFPRR